MSSCLIIQEEDRIFMSGDSAISATVEGKLYRLNEDGKKLYAFDNMLVFCAGKVKITDNVINNFKKPYTIDNLQKVILDVIKLYPDMDDFDLGITVGTIENNKSIMYQITSANDFQIERTEGSNLGAGVYAVGIKTDECFNCAAELLQTGKYSVQDIYIKTYNKIAFEGVGGNLTLAYLDKDGVHILLHQKIKEPENMARIYFHNIFANMVAGKLILGERVEAADPNGYLTINGDLITIRDNKNTEKVKMGQYEQGKWGISIYNSSGNLVMTGDELNCNNINVKNMSANSITGGTLDFSKITAENLNVSGSIDTSNLRIKGENIYDVINNADIARGNTYINSNGAGQTINGTNYNFKKMIKIGQGSVSSGSTSATIDLGADFRGRQTDVIVCLSGFNATASALSGVNLTQANYSTTDGTFKIAGAIQSTDDGGTIYYSYIAVA